MKYTTKDIKLGSFWKIYDPSDNSYLIEKIVKPVPLTTSVVKDIRWGFGVGENVYYKNKHDFFAQNSNFFITRWLGFNDYYDAI